MIQASITGSTITITADADSGAQAARIPGATRTAKMPPLTWILPFSLEAAADLRAAGARASAELRGAIQDAVRTVRYVEEMKKADKVEPMRSVPIKPGVTLYNHQVRAFNIALALFGYEIGERSNE